MIEGLRDYTVDNVLIGVPSYRRPQNVDYMQSYYEEIVWCVADEQDYQEYLDAGAHEVTICPAGKGLAKQRNHLYDLANAMGQWCFQCDDDLKSLMEWHGKTHADSRVLDFLDAVSTIFYAAQTAEVLFGGALSTANPFYGSSRVHTHAFIQGGMHILNPISGLRWSEDSSVMYKDDWEMTLRCLSMDHGAVARVDWILPHFDFKSSRDTGAVGEQGGGMTKTWEGEMECALELIRRYPDLVKKSSRPLELTLIHTVKTMSNYKQSHYYSVNDNVKQEMFHG